MQSQVLDIFYNSFVREASTGRVDCYFMYNVLFATKLENKFISEVVDYDSLLVPILNIYNKEEFNRLLEEYVELAYDFYDKSNYPEEVFDGTINDKNRIIEKIIMTLLFANATMEDFTDPINFLKRRIEFLKNDFSSELDAGYSDIFNANLQVSIEKDIINNETPWQFVSSLISSDEERFVFPAIKFGVSGDEVYVYAIQQKGVNKNRFTKKINRSLYKIGEGFLESQDNYDIYGEGNLKDVTPSFVIAINIFLAYFSQLGYHNFTVSSLLIERWNAKAIANKIKYHKGRVTSEEYLELISKQEAIQSNLTEKFIRNFLRLQYHFPGIDILSYPFDTSYLKFRVDSLNKTNNSLMHEVTNLINKSFSDKSRK